MSITSRLPTWVALAVCTGAALAFAPGGDLEIVSYTIDGGGGTSSGGVYELRGTVGQPDTGVMSGGDLTLSAGFWAGPAATTCTGDTDGNGAVDVDDLVNVILDWSTDGAGHGGDVNGSGVVDVDDLVLVILNTGVCPSS